GASLHTFTRVPRACRSAADSGRFSTATACTPRPMRITPPLLFCLLLCLATASTADQKTIYGLNEYARIMDFDLELPAKLDTGAMTASLSAHHIQRFERDGETWVRFQLDNGDAEGKPIERPVSRISRIKR